MRHHQGNPIIDMMMHLDLSKEQKESIYVILKELHNSIKHPTLAFTQTLLNKNELIAILKEKDIKRIENEAAAIEKIYKLLDTIQKKHLKTMLDMDELMQSTKQYEGKR